VFGIDYGLLPPTLFKTLIDKFTELRRGPDRVSIALTHQAATHFD
jgi:hypothetical protein